MNNHLPLNLLWLAVAHIDEALEQVNTRDANQCPGDLYLEITGINFL